MDATIKKPGSETTAAGRSRVWAALAALAALSVAARLAAPAVERALTTVSTDDAYVNGHVTVVAPRVPGQVARVLVEDSARVKQGDLLVELDREPYHVQVELKEATLARAEASLRVAEAQTRATAAVLVGLRWKLEHAMEGVDAQVALLHTKIAAHESQKASAAKAQADRSRARNLLPSGSISREEVDHRDRTFEAADANAAVALQEVYQARAALGLPPHPASSETLDQVPPRLRQTHSSVRQVLAELNQTAAQLGLAPRAGETDPARVVPDLTGDAAHNGPEAMLDGLVRGAPAVQDALAAVQTARRDLEAANLNLRYTEVRAEIDGVITRRNVNPGNTVQAGQGLMAVRSLSEIWIDANFKETQLADLRIGQKVDLYVDMYGDNRVFSGRITGFTYGTGSTLALLPPQNATGNFVKVVQRLPVRIELTEPNPEETPLFAGLSVVPVVRVAEPPSGADAGRYLQPQRGPTTLASLAHRVVHP